MDLIKFIKLNWSYIKLLTGIIAIIFIVRFWLKSPVKDTDLIKNVILSYGGDTGIGLFVTLLIGIGVTCIVHSSSLST